MCDINALTVVVRKKSSLESFQYSPRPSLDYDLCTLCISSGSAERHNPFHEFFEITEPGRVIVHTLDVPRQGPSSINDRSSAPASAADRPAVHSARCDLCDSRIEGYRYVSYPLPLS